MFFLLGNVRPRKALSMTGAEYPRLVDLKRTELAAQGILFIHKARGSLTNVPKCAMRVLNERPSEARCAMRVLKKRPLWTPKRAREGIPTHGRLQRAKKSGPEKNNLLTKK